MLKWIRAEYWRRYFTAFIVICISGYALYLRILRIAGHTDFSDDELFQIAIATNRSFLQFLKALQLYEFCSFISGDYYLTWIFFKLFSYNIWGLTLPHLIATILGFYLLYLVCKLYFKTIWSYIITFTIVCFNFTLMDHVRVIRTYAVLPTLALGAFYFSQLLVENVEMGIKKRCLIGAFFVFIIWFHVYGILILLLPFAYSLLAELHNKSFKVIFKKNVKFISIVLFIAMPLWLYSVFGPHQSYRGGDPAEITFAHIPNPLDDTIGFLKAIFGNLMGDKRLYPLLISIVFPFIIPFRDSYKQIGFLFITVFLPIILILHADLITRYYFLQRQFIWTMPFFALFMGWVWESFFIYIKEKLHFKKRRFE